METKSKSVFPSLKNFDLYTKIDEDYVIKTSYGASLSLIGWIIIAILVLAELGGYMNVQLQEHMIVDTTLGQQLNINVDITFHALKCTSVHLDAMDIAGDNQVDIDHNIFKQRLNEKGHPIGAKGVEIIGKVI